MIVARDEGPGIEHLDLALTDGYSTGKGLGLGLPGAKRLMDEFAVQSTVGSRNHRDHEEVGLPMTSVTPVMPVMIDAVNCCLDVAVEQAPTAGQMVSGDRHVIILRRTALCVAVIDGLGHGEAANQASEAVSAALSDLSACNDNLEHLFRQAHLAARSTRGGRHEHGFVHHEPISAMVGRGLAMSRPRCCGPIRAILRVPVSALARRDRRLPFAGDPPAVAANGRQ